PGFDPIEFHFHSGYRTRSRGAASVPPREPVGESAIVAIVDRFCSRKRRGDLRRRPDFRTQTVGRRTQDPDFLPGSESAPGSPATLSAPLSRWSTIERPPPSPRRDLIAARASRTADLWPATAGR